MKRISVLLVFWVLNGFNAAFGQSQGVMMASSFSPEENIMIKLFTGNCRIPYLNTKYPFMATIELRTTNETLEACYGMVPANQKISLFIPKSNKEAVLTFQNFNLDIPKLQNAFAQPR